MSDTKPSAGAAVARQWYDQIYGLLCGQDFDTLPPFIDAAIEQARREASAAMLDKARAIVAAEIARDGGAAPHGASARIEQALRGLLLPEPVDKSADQQS